LLTQIADSVRDLTMKAGKLASVSRVKDNEARLEITLYYLLEALCRNLGRKTCDIA
jgi:hypothetical protein